MKRTSLLSVLLLLIVLALPVIAHAEQKPDVIIEKMAVKLTRGVTNTFTCIAEIPKQSMLTVKEMGDVGYVVGPLKGIGMMLYRGVVGLTETIFFLVPQPGYYDPMMEPTYVWQNWEPKREVTPTLPDEKAPEGKK